MAALSFKILVSDDPAALKRSKSQRVFGPLWVTLGTKAFPKAQWRDFPVAALAAWTARCLKLQTVGDSAQLGFVEGEHKLRVELLEDSLVKVTALTNGEEQITCVTSKTHLWTELARVGHQVLAQCSRLGWPSDEWNQLRSNLEAHKHPARWN